MSVHISGVFSEYQLLNLYIHVILRCSRGIPDRRGPVRPILIQITQFLGIPHPCWPKARLWRARLWRRVRNAKGAQGDDNILIIGDGQIQGS